MEDVAKMLVMTWRTWLPYVFEGEMREHMRRILETEGSEGGPETLDMLRAILESGKLGRILREKAPWLHDAARKALGSGVGQPVSGEALLALVGGKGKVVRYRDLADVGSVDELLGPHGRVFILYESQPGYGHWTVLLRRGKNSVELFDSYGLPVDDELDFLPVRFRQETGQARAHLSQLLGHSPYRIEYNNHRLQSTRPGIATCGKWCALRALNSRMGVDAFARRVRAECRRRKLSPDELVDFCMTQG